MEKYIISKRTSLLFDTLVLSERLYEKAHEAILAYYGDDNPEAERRFDECFLPLADYIDKMVLSSISEHLFEGKTEI